MEYMLQPVFNEINDLQRMTCANFNHSLSISFSYSTSPMTSQMFSISVQFQSKITTVKSKYIFMLLINLAGNLIVLKRMVTILNIKFQQS